MYPMGGKMGPWSHLLDYVQGEKYLYCFYTRKFQYIECFDPHLKILLFMNFIWSKAAKSRKLPILPLTTLQEVLVVFRSKYRRF